MDDAESLDALFRDAVSAIDAGDIDALNNLLMAHPRLVRERLKSPGAWLRDVVGDDLEGFFRQPYLLWFVAEDPVRHGKLPRNIASVAHMIIEAARRERVDSLQEQLDYALMLVSWSWIARECGVQIELIDVLLDAGASPDGETVYEGRYGTHADCAIYNRNYAAAERLLQRGAPLTLTTALCLGRWADVDRLAAATTLQDKQDAFVQAAKNGHAGAVRRMLALGMDPTTVSDRVQSHGTALHHAVYSGNLDAVQALVEAGADLSRRDTIYDATPLGWAMYGEQQDSEETGVQQRQYREIADYLRDKGAV